MSVPATIGLIGATGALGKELLAVLDAAPWRHARVVAMASAATAETTVSYGDDTVPVDDVEPVGLAELDGVVVAVPRERAAALVDAAAAVGVPVVDTSGHALEVLSQPLVVPWVNRDVLAAPRPRDVVGIPSAAGILLATILAPLARAGLVSAAEATVLLPASAWGRGGVDELSRQVVALFNAGTPPRKVFPHGFAFDLLPQIGAPGATGWTADEVRVAAEVARLTRVRAAVTLVGTPVFSGISATLRLSVPDAVVPEALIAALSDAGVEVLDDPSGRKLPRPRRVEGSGKVAVARLRAIPGASAIALWAAADNLHLSAVAAVGVLAAVRRRGVPGGDDDEDERS